MFLDAQMVAAILEYPHDFYAESAVKMSFVHENNQQQQMNRQKKTQNQSPIVDYSRKATCY